MSLAMNKNAPAHDNDTANKVYEIVVVAIASAMIVVCGTVFLLLVMRRRWNMCGITYAQQSEENTAPGVNVNLNARDKIPTIDLQGPAHITYINERSRAPSEIPIGEVKLSRDALLYISLITCMNLPDNMPSEERL